MNTGELLFEKYGPTLDIAELAEVLKMSEGTLKNRLSAGTCPVPTYREGGKRVANVQDVATYLDRRRNEAEKEFRKERAHLAA